ncbi:MAG: M48 family metallopeptidase [Alicyclobacillaceae bacterium]|nr:M48 family metallopeptidase [Alicyclobacillaceae bacterium]
MQGTLHYGNSTIPYRLIPKPTAKDCTISVQWQTGVTVVVPEHMDQRKIEAVLKRKAPWILQKLAELREIRPVSTKREFISGEKFPYLGRQYRLHVLAEDNAADVSLKFQNGRFIAVVPKVSGPMWREERLRAAFRDWYIQNGIVKVKERLNLFAPRLGLRPTDVVVKDQKLRWGSCTKTGIVNINWRVLMAPLRIVDYVVVHELAHLIHADHSPDFWAVVASVMPDYEERKHWLRVNGATLTL